MPDYPKIPFPRDSYAKLLSETWVAFAVAATQTGTQSPEDAAKWADDMLTEFANRWTVGDEK